MSPANAEMTRCSHTAPIPVKILEVTPLPIPPLPVCVIATLKKILIKLHLSEISLSDGDLYTVCERVCVDTPNCNSQQIHFLSSNTVLLQGQ